MDTFILKDEDKDENTQKVDNFWFSPYLANGTRYKSKCYPRTKPSVFQNSSAALQVEYVTTVQLKLKKKKEGYKQM